MPIPKEHLADGKPVKLEKQHVRLIYTRSAIPVTTTTNYMIISPVNSRGFYSVEVKRISGKQITALSNAGYTVRPTSMAVSPKVILNKSGTKQPQFQRYQRRGVYGYQMGDMANRAAEGAGTIPKSRITFGSKMHANSAVFSEPLFSYTVCGSSHRKCIASIPADWPTDRVNKALDICKRYHCKTPSTSRSSSSSSSRTATKEAQIRLTMNSELIQKARNVHSYLTSLLPDTQKYASKYTATVQKLISGTARVMGLVDKVVSQSFYAVSLKYVNQNQVTANMVAKEIQKNKGGPTVKPPTTKPPEEGTDWWKKFTDWFSGFGITDPMVIVGILVVGLVILKVVF